MVIDPNHPRVLIGRSKTCDIRTRNNTVSRQHAKVTWENGAYHLVDLGSSNGTFFEGQRVSEHWLEDGDRFTCGAFKISFKLEDHESDPAPGTYDQPAPSNYLTEEPSEQYPMAAELLEGDIAFGSELENPTDDSPDNVAAAAWDDFSFNHSRVDQPASSEVPATHLPFPSGENNTSSSQAEPPPIPATPNESDKIDEEELPATQTPPSRFEEFNRQLEIKDQQLAELRDQARTLEEDNLLLHAEVDALKTTLDEERTHGLSTQEFTTLQAANEKLQNETDTLKKELEERNGRLESLEAQILRDRDQRMSTEEIENLQEAKEERDRLWIDRERLETELLQVKRQLSGEADTESRDESALTETLDGLRSELRQAKDQYQELATTHQAHQEKHADLEQAHAAALSDISTLQQQFAKEQEQFVAQTEAMASAENDHQQAMGLLQQERDQLHTEISALRTSVAELTANSQDAAGQSKQLAAALKKLGKLEGENSTLKTQLKDKAAEKKVAAKEITALRKDQKKQADAMSKMVRGDLHSEAEKKIAQLTESLSALQSELVEAQQKLDQQSALEAQLEDQKASLEKSHSAEEFQELQDENVALQKSLDKASKEAKAHNTALDAVKDELKVSKGRVSELEASQKDHAKALKQSTDAADKLRSELKQNDKSRKALTKEVDALKKSLEDALSNTDAIEENKKLAASLEEQTTSVIELKNEIDELKNLTKKTQTLLDTTRKEMTDIKDERDELLSANKAQVKRVSTLIKQIETLEQTEDTKQTYEAELSRLTKELTSLQATHKSHVEQGLAKQAVVAEQQQAVQAAKQKVSQLEKELTTMKGSFNQATDQLAALQTELDDAKSTAPAPVDMTPQLLEGVDALIEEVNDRISGFRNNCETVRYCIDDIVAGQDAIENQSAAIDMLSDNTAEVEALKKALKRFRNDHLRKVR
jgi:hypothetical protein